MNGYRDLILLGVKCVFYYFKDRLNTLYYILDNNEPHILEKHTHVRFTALWTLSGITQVSRYQKGKTILDFTEARNSEWQWHHTLSVEPNH